MQGGYDAVDNSMKLLSVIGRAHLAHCAHVYLPAAAQRLTTLVSAQHSTASNRSTT
ncbi:hypothetical protein C8Q79DRAFT_991244 [Trametes meyenii]|nr:hypothetical protein C8Q79DRAFT_991244 [Trametes meyenii]